MHRCDNVKEAAGHVAAPTSIMPERPPLAVAHFDKRLIFATVRQRGVVKLVSAHDCARSTDRAVAKEARLAIAEMQLALRKAGRMAEKPNRRVALALR